MFKKNKPQIGYKPASKKIKKKIKHSDSQSQLFKQGTAKITLTERFIKSIIYVVLRMVVKPSKWKEPEKNYQIIDRAYKRIMSSDFIFIPSSIAFYLMMSFMPILSMITFLYIIPGVSPWLEARNAGPSAVGDVIGKFIPGTKSLFSDLQKNISIGRSTAFTGGIAVATLSSFAISTWIAAGGFSKLVFTQSHIYKHKFTGGYWSNKAKGIFMVFSFTLVLLSALVINILLSGAIQKTDWSNTTKEVVTYSFLIVALFIGMIAGFTMLFKLSPRYKIKIKHVIPGALVAGIPTGIFLALFGPITSIWSYNSYGAIGAIMYIGMASLFVTNFIFIGLATNAAYYKTFVSLKMKNKWTFSNK